MKRVVVTGLGFISPIGNDEKTIVASLKEKKIGIKPIASFDASRTPISLAAECSDFQAEDYFEGKTAKRLDRVNAMGVVAARKAIEDAQLDLSTMDTTKVAVIVASGIGGLSTIEAEGRKLETSGPKRISPFFIPRAIANMTAAHVAIDLGIHGPVSCPVTACAAGSNAILDAFWLLRTEQCEVALAGGSEASITELGIGGFAAMRALSESKDPHRASIPFDQERDGFVMGEGAAILVLETLEHAIKRGAYIYGELVGAAMTCDANHITAPDPEGKWAAEAMCKAMEIAGVKPEEVQYINAHGTSTPLNDAVETKAIRSAFKDAAEKVHVSSTKSSTGHLLGASGALEAAIVLLCMEHHFIPPTLGYKVEDRACDLSITPNEPVFCDMHVAMSNSLGFGGHNVSLIFKKGNYDL